MDPGPEDRGCLMWGWALHGKEKEPRGAVVKIEEHSETHRDEYEVSAIFRTTTVESPRPGLRRTGSFLWTPPLNTSILIKNIVAWESASPPRRDKATLGWLSFWEVVIGSCGCWVPQTLASREKQMSSTEILRFIFIQIKRERGQAGGRGSEF